MLEVRDIHRAYGPVKAVDGVSFRVDSGEIVGLLGHNGAGKTTIMKILSGYLEPDTGSLWYEGSDVTRQPAIVQHTLGYLPENLPVYPDLTVGECLDYAADLKGLSGADKRTAIRHAVDATELGDRLDAPVATLSRGLKQRVGVAQAVLGKPSVLILDEPSNGLDPSQTEHMRALIRRLAEDATVILSSHVMQEVEALCSRVLVIDRGRLALDERLDALRNRGELQLRCTATEADLQDILQVVLRGVPPTSLSIELQDSAVDANGTRWHTYDIDTGTQSLSDSELAGLNRTLVERGVEVACLQRNRRTLHELFMDVTAPRGNDAAAPAEEDLSHAA